MEHAILSGMLTQPLITEHDWHQCRPHTGHVIAPPPGNVYVKSDGRWWCITPEEMQDANWMRHAAPLSEFGEAACERVWFALTAGVGR